MRRREIAPIVQLVVALTLAGFCNYVVASDFPETVNQIMTCIDEDSFVCLENECIPLEKKCNGVAECSNGRDETVWECGCLPNEFFCNGTCIDLMLRCDTKPDCDDGSDEANCEMYACPLSHTKCNNHFCIPADAVCDFSNDCGDNSDEQDCLMRDCWFGEFRCRNGQCLARAHLCDGIRDCQDGSDEEQCLSIDFRECSDGSKVHRYFWCDNWPDCKADHADELDCGNCTDKQFRCSNSRCILLGNVCDTVCDCADTCEDEAQCEDRYITVDDTRLCIFNSTITCHISGRCIHEDFLCDHELDCQTGTNSLDEFGCHSTPDRCPKGEYFLCPDGRCIPVTLKCDFVRDCLDGSDEYNCDFPSCSESEFRCKNGQCISQSSVCDTVYDCLDKSDELKCKDYPCPDGHRKCNNGQCIKQEWWCDFIDDCHDRSDEDNCSIRDCDADEFRCRNGQCVPKSYVCFKTGEERSGCADNSHLLNCKDSTCPSAHKCLNSYCIDQSNVCNERIDCHDSWNDEEGCPFTCSAKPECECQDIIINCTNVGLEHLPEDVELEISKFILTGNFIGLNLHSDTFKQLGRISYLDLSNNSISTIAPETFKYLWRLRILHLQKNHIDRIYNGTFYGLMLLGTLSLQGNDIKVIDAFAFYGLSSLKSLDLSHQQLINISQNAFLGLRQLRQLNLSHNKLIFLLDGSLSGLPQLLSLDLSHNKIQIMGSNVFHGLTSLQHLVTDEFRFCCLARHVPNCLPHADEFSSCEDLMSNIVLRVCIWVLGLIAFIGNILVIAWRIIYRTNNKVHSFLITNLAIGDMCMGVYLLIIASVDSRYRGVYFIYDSLWKTSELCQFAGFVSTFSSELSVFTLTVITMDRFVGIAFPFRVKKLKMHHTRMVMLSIWAAVFILAGLPLLNLDYFRHFYGRSGVCLALHITHEKPSGWEYSVFIFLLLNFISFSIIAVAYFWMFLIARNTQKAVRSPEAKRDNTMARRMTLIVVTDFCCWMPIILLGIISLTGIVIPPQVFAWIAVFVLPLNAAINPVLYTLSTAPFLGPARKRVSRFRRSFITSFTNDTRTGLTMVATSTTDERSGGVVATELRIPDCFGPGNGERFRNISSIDGEVVRLEHFKKKREASTRKKLSSKWPRPRRDPYQNSSSLYD